METINYFGLRTYEVAICEEFNDAYLVMGVSWNTVEWVEKQDKQIYLPLNNITTQKIREGLNKGQEIKISKMWSNDGQKEVHPVYVQLKYTEDIEGYKRVAKRILKQNVNPIMASISAAEMYGFNVLHSKFLQKGYVLVEETEPFTMVRIFEDAENKIQQEQIEASEEILNDLNRYLEYKQKLDKVYFVNNKLEDTFNKIDNLNNKHEIDKLINDFQTEMSTLNSLK